MNFRTGVPYECKAPRMAQLAQWHFKRMGSKGNPFDYVMVNAAGDSNCFEVTTDVGTVFCQIDAPVHSVHFHKVFADRKLFHFTLEGVFPEIKMVAIHPLTRERLAVIPLKQSLFQNDLRSVA